MKNKFLKGNFYIIGRTHFLPEEENQFSVHVTLNSKHEVYAGHFPGMAVAPGVCMIGMIREVLEDHLQKLLFLNEASDIKFIKPVLPAEQDSFEIHYKLTFSADQVIEVNAMIKSGDHIYVKLKSKFTVLPFRS